MKPPKRPKQVYWLVFSVLLLLFCGVTYHTVPPLRQDGYAPCSQPASFWQPSEDKLNLNTACVEELCNLEGVGDTLARRIVTYREQNGRYASVEGLAKVKGISQKTVERLRGEICVS